MSAAVFYIIPRLIAVLDFRIQAEDALGTTGMGLDRQRRLAILRELREEYQKVLLRVEDRRPLEREQIQVLGAGAYDERINRLDAG